MAVMTIEILTKIMAMTTTKIVLQLHRGVGSNTGLVDSVTVFFVALLVHRVLRSAWTHGMQKTKAQQ